MSPLRVFVRLAIVALGLPALPVLLSGDWTWQEGWAFFLVTAAGFVVSRALAARRHPDLVAERMRGTGQEGTKAFDRVLAPLVALGVIVVAVVAGLDHRWHGASEWFPAWSRWLALAVIVVGYAWGTWAMVENRFFSGVVRIQHDRGHHVVSSGPYAVTRHPGYAGTLAFYLACPVLLASPWAIVPALLLAGALVVRTALEDQVLRLELPGYAEYARRTRYRLVPWLW